MEIRETKLKLLDNYKQKLEEAKKSIINEPILKNEAEGLANNLDFYIITDLEKTIKKL